MKLVASSTQQHNSKKIKKKPKKNLFHSIDQHHTINKSKGLGIRETFEKLKTKYNNNNNEPKSLEPEIDLSTQGKLEAIPPQKEEREVRKDMLFKGSSVFS